MVTRMDASELKSGGLQELDVVLEINGSLVTEIKDLDVSEKWPVVVKAKVLREKNILDIDVPTKELDIETKRLVVWAGALIQGKRYYH